MGLRVGETDILVVVIVPVVVARRVREVELEGPVSGRRRLL